jgi:hypothetical protein
VWQIPVKEMNKLLTTEKDFLRKFAGISKIEKVRDIKIREIITAQDKPGIIHTIENKQLC